MRLVPLAAVLRWSGLCCLSAALGSGASCGDSECNRWSQPEALDLGVTVDLHAVTFTKNGGDPRWFWAVGADGTVVEVGDDVVVHHPVAVDLHDVATDGDYIYAVGDAGTVVRGRRTGAPAWEVIDLGVTTSLWRVLPSGARTIVLGDDVFQVRDAVTDTWSSPPRPPGGWGELRALVRDPVDKVMVVVGRGGQAWSARDILGVWKPVDMGTQEDLLASWNDLVFGTHGTILKREAEGWRRIEVAETVDFVAMAPDDYLLGSDGRAFQWSKFHGLTSFATVEPGATDLAIQVDDQVTAAIVVGAAGQAHELHFENCGL